eukprot:scaffold3067_cov19-Tisochrysis_lutea.AAC.1
MRKQTQLKQQQQQKQQQSCDRYLQPNMSMVTSGTIRCALAKRHGGNITNVTAKHQHNTSIQAAAESVLVMSEWRVGVSLEGGPQHSITIHCVCWRMWMWKRVYMRTCVYVRVCACVRACAHLLEIAAAKQAGHKSAWHVSWQPFESAGAVSKTADKLEAEADGCRWDQEVQEQEVQQVWVQEEEEQQ